MRARISTFAILPFLIAQTATAQGCGPLAVGDRIRVAGGGNAVTGRLTAYADTGLEIEDARSGVPLSLPVTEALVLEKHCADPATDGAVVGALLGTAAVALTYGTLFRLLDEVEDATGVETDRGPNRFVVAGLAGAAIGGLLGYSLDAARDGSRWARIARETRVGVAHDGSLRLGVTVAVR